MAVGELFEAGIAGLAAEVTLAAEASEAATEAAGEEVTMGSAALP